MEEHNHNLSEALARMKEVGITLKLEKSTFCRPEIKWFGRTFSATGMSADKEKIKKTNHHRKASVY